jgi:hypothetical protein
MEALTAVGLASNVVQFISFTCETLSKSREIYLSTSGTTKEFDDIRIISQDLFSFKSHIESQKKAMPSLSDLAERCISIADEIVRAIKQLEDKFAPKESKPGGAPTKSRKKWESFRQALHCVWDKQRVTDLERRLERLRDQLEFHLISANR